MRKFIINTLRFVLVSFMILLSFQALISLKASHKSTTGHDNLELTTNVDSDLVFIGSSRCRAHFDPAFFKKEFNLSATNIGVDGHSELSMSYVRLSDYLRFNSAPKYVILNFDPFMSGGEIGQPTENNVIKDNFAKYSFAPFNKKWKTVEHFGFDFREKYLPLYSIFKYEQLSNCLFNTKKYSYLEYGYARNNSLWDTIKNPIHPRKEKPYKIIEDEDNVTKSLNQIKSLCAKKGIQLICIQTPVHQSIFNDKTFMIPKRICKKLNIPFVDANYEFLRNDLSNFYNSNHINTRGVTAMNNMLKRESLLLELFKKRS